MRHSHQSGRVPQIAVVEDEQLVAMDVEMQLAALGYGVVGIADTGADALRLIEATQPDLVLMDIHLRGPMDGIAVAAELQRRNLHLPVVFVTAYGSGEALLRARAVSCSGYLIKPYRPQELRDALSHALEQYSGSSSELLFDAEQAT